MSITNSTTEMESYEVDPGDKNGVLAIWQLVYEVQPVVKATAAEIAAGTDAFGNHPHTINSKTKRSN